MSSTKPNTNPIIVIIATSFARTTLLLERSLKSVYRQININPHQIYIVDDNPINSDSLHSDEYFKIKSGIRALRQETLKPRFEEFKLQKKRYHLKFENFFHTNLIQNTRTKGFSGTGAWNTAAFKALRYSGKNYYLAFLDDDDEWKENYLETLYKSVTESKKKIVKEKIETIASIAGITRIEKDETIEVKVKEKDITKEKFFIENPGLQGSNLFIDLKTFWSIGGFDESLKSVTDRDFGIRLVEYLKINDSKRIVTIDDVLVNHYATSKNRVTSTPENKKEGLDTFYRKYLHQFPKNIQEQSLKRAKKLFNYSIPENTKIQNENSAKIEKRVDEKDIKPFHLMIGTISDNTKNLKELFKSFLALYQRDSRYILDYRFLILENTANNDEYEIRPLINYFVSEKKINAEIIKHDSNGRLSISESRTILQQKVYERGKELFKNNFIAWIIDDDHLFKMDTKNDTEIIPNYFETILEHSNRGIDAIFGQISDAPPLPFLSTLRTQLIDFYYNLTYFANCKPNEKFELNELQKQSIEREEFYYDLSNTNFQHLEYPYYLNQENNINFEAFKEFLQNTAKLSDGINVFRKLTYRTEEIGKTENECSIYRGGNTIIYNPKLLLTPNYAPQKEYNRRSDFNWAIINRNIYGYIMHEIVLPLKHDRGLQETSLIINKKKLKADIEGLIFYRLLDEILTKDDWKTKKNIRKNLEFYNQLKRKAFIRIKINNYRIQSLIDLILEIIGDVKYWWFKNTFRVELDYHIQKNIFTLEILKFEFGKRKLQRFMQDLEKDIKIDDCYVSKVIAEIEDIEKSGNV